MKYVDDMTLAQATNLPECLISNPDPHRPFELHDHTGHLRPAANYQLQEQLDMLV